MKVVVIDYNAGNIQSVAFALERLGVQAIISRNPEIIQSADKVIFPGVGEAGTTLRFLKNHLLDRVIKNLRQPVLGICLGMQLLCSHSEEADTECLGIIPQKVLKFRPAETGQKVPHMGWNQIQNLQDEIFSPELENEFVYFVHSYHVEIGECTTATTDYILPFSSGVQKDNFFATQFHPEKSGSVGELILQNFLGMVNK